MNIISFLIASVIGLVFAVHAYKYMYVSAHAESSKKLMFLRTLARFWEESSHNKWLFLGVTAGFFIAEYLVMTIYQSHSPSYMIGIGFTYGLYICAYAESYQTSHRNN